MPRSDDELDPSAQSPSAQSPSAKSPSTEWRRQMDTRGKRILWISMIVGTVVGGGAFVYKVVEFTFTLSSPEARGFAEVPVMVYFCVAAGWLCLLAWCFSTGKFKNNEQAKLDMLRMEEEYDRLGI